MEYTKKYTAIQVREKNINNDQLKVDLTYGDVEGPYYNRIYPETEFDTEEEAIEYAIEYAHKKDKYAKWIIVPIIKFE